MIHMPCTMSSRPVLFLVGLVSLSVLVSGLHPGHRPLQDDSAYRRSKRFLDHPHLSSSDSETKKVDGGWGQWYAIAQCTVTCGNGSLLLTRKCDSPEPSGGGADCGNHAVREVPCHRAPCHVDGGWAAWSFWLPCTVSCGPGTHLRVRTCTNPSPSGVGGADCLGEGSEIKPCHRKHCPVPAGWNEWNSWTDCAVTCGNGTRFRIRSCNNPHEENVGCRNQQVETEHTSCSSGPCPAVNTAIPSTATPAATTETTTAAAATFTSSATLTAASAFTPSVTTTTTVSAPTSPPTTTAAATTTTTSIATTTTTPASTPTTTTERSTTITAAASTTSEATSSTTAATTSKTTPTTSAATTSKTTTPTAATTLKTTPTTSASTTPKTTPSTTTTAATTPSTTTATTTTVVTTTPSAATTTATTSTSTVSTPLTSPMATTTPTPSPSTTSSTPASTTLPSTTTPSTTTVPTTTTKPTTTAQVATGPSVDCFVCDGPPDVCEYAYVEQTCTYPNNYCINDLENSSDGGRSLTRRCGTRSDCRNGWYLSYSDDDKCTGYDENQAYTRTFKCSYCCTSALCNEHIVPSLDTLYHG